MTAEDQVAAIRALPRREIPKPDAAGEWLRAVGYNEAFDDVLYCILTDDRRQQQVPPVASWVSYSPALVTTAACLQSTGSYQRIGRMVTFGTDTTLAGFDGRTFEMNPPVDAVPDPMTAVSGVVLHEDQTTECTVELQAHNGKFIVRPIRRVTGRVRFLFQGHFFTKDAS